MSMLFKRIKDWATSITAFRTGDVIPVDGPDGTAKMAKDDLLKNTCGLKENASGTISTHKYNLLTYTGNVGDVVGIAFTTDARVNLCVVPSGGSATPILQNTTEGYVEYTMTATSATFGFFLYNETSTTYDINLFTGLNNKSFDHSLKIEGLEEQVGVRETASGTISTHTYNLLRYTGKVGDVVGIYFETSANVNLCVKPSGGSISVILTNKSKGYVEYTMTATIAEFGFFLYNETSTTYSIALYSKLNKDFASDTVKVGELSEQVGVNNSKSGSVSSSNFNLMSYSGKVGDVVVVDFATSKNVNLVANSSSILNNRNKGHVKYTLTTTSVNFGFYLYEATSTDYAIKITTAMNSNIADIEYDTATINDGLGDSVKANGSTSSDNYNLVTFTGKVGDVVGIYFETDKRVNLVAKPSGGSATPLLQNRTSGYIEYTLTTTSTTFGFYRYEGGSTSYKLWVSRYVNGIEPRLNALTQKCRDFGFPARKLNFLSLGDSITTNSYYIPILAGLLGVNVRYNLAVAGATVCDRNSTTGYDGNPTQSVDAGNVLGNQLQKLINNPATYTETPDIILISAITNDGAPSATDSDFDEIETHFTSGTTAVEITAPTFDASDTYAPHRKTVAGSLRYVVGTLAKMYPNALIFICTPIQASTSSASKNYPDIMERKQKLITNVGKRLGVDVLHVGENCGICSDFEYEGGFWTSSYATDEHTHQGRDLVDGLHPNSSGSNKMAKYIYTQIMDRIMGYYK